MTKRCIEGTEWTVNDYDGHCTPLYADKKGTIDLTFKETYNEVEVSTYGYGGNTDTHFIPVEVLIHMLNSAGYTVEKK